MLQLFNVPNLLHIRSIASRSEYTADFGTRVNVVGCDERAGRVVNQRAECDGESLKGVR